MRRARWRRLQRTTRASSRIVGCGSSSKLRQTAETSRVFLSGIEELELPVAHGEGRFVPRDKRVLESLRDAGQFVLKYASIAKPKTKSATRNPKSEIASPVAYPDNPNGAIDDVAGVCDTTGRVLGRMPHPERFVDPTQHPTWTRGPRREVGAGLRIFQNAVRYFS